MFGFRSIKTGSAVLVDILKMGTNEKNCLNAFTYYFHSSQQGKYVNIYE